MKNTRLQGFTLVEMSIVLVIIGVLVGGVLYGESLLEASRLQTVITDLDSYTTAVTNFKQTYQSLPGDFAAATTVWPADSNCPTGGHTGSTCNGNGDGTITNTAANQTGESFLFWQHLYMAGMFTQNLSNQSGPGGKDDSIPGTNVPAGSIKGSGFSVLWWGTVTYGNSDTFSPTNPSYYGNIISFGGSHVQVSGSVQYSITQAPIITPIQASQIDTKIDDGLPAYGKVRAYKQHSSIEQKCTTSDNEPNALYNLVDPPLPRCSLIFLMGF